MVRCTPLFLFDFFELLAIRMAEPLGFEALNEIAEVNLKDDDRRIGSNGRAELELGMGLELETLKLHQNEVCI